MVDTDREEFRVTVTEAGDSEEEKASERDEGERKSVVARVSASLEAEIEPLAAYAALSGYRTTGGENEGTEKDADYSFLLESAEKVASSDPAGAFAPAASAGSDHARYSFLGYDPAAVVTIEDGVSETTVLDDRYADFLAPTASDRERREASQNGDTEGQENGGDDEHGEDSNTLDHLREVLSGVELAGFPETDRQLLDGGLVGFLAYDTVYDLHLGEVGLERPESSVPDAQFVLSTGTLVFDHAPERGAEEGPEISLVCTPLVRPGEDPGEIYDALCVEAERVEKVLSNAGSVETGGFRREGEQAGSREHYEAGVEQAIEHVLDGDIYQGVLSRTREYEGQVDPLGLYEALREVNPSPYMYLLEFGDRAVVGASPETLLSVSDREIVSNPIAGTCSRGRSPVEDRRLAGEMLADDKERAEHTMLVDLARNDVRRVARSGSVRVPEFMNVLKYSHVQHIESTVTGRLRGDRDAFDAVRAAFPAGTLSGAPKIRAMEIVDALEERPRGLYGGGVGYFSWGGDADLAIVIRTATIERGVRSAEEGAIDGEEAVDRITVQAGAGIVADSDPASEYAETERKMDGVLAALRRIESPKPTPEAKR
ncbi:anthranilate synthase component I [Halobacteriales archaeon QS_3_64_16]|nr:MAG: anthranilate synthase component I [Halobacteriales archaeon QS_3_64_16]